MWNPKLGLQATHSLTCNLIHSWSSDASLPVLDYPLIRHAWAPLILIYPGKAFTNKERYAHEHHSYPCCSEQLQHCCTTEHHPQWNIWVVNALLKSILRTVFSGGVRVLQSTPLCNIFRSAWLISSSNTPLKHITFLPPPWLEKCTSHGSLCSLLLRVTVQCSRRKHTCTIWFCVCVCICEKKHEHRICICTTWHVGAWCYFDSALISSMMKQPCFSLVCILLYPLLFSQPLLSLLGTKRLHHDTVCYKICHFCQKCTATVQSGAVNFQV